MCPQPVDSREAGQARRGVYLCSPRCVEADSPLCHRAHTVCVGGGCVAAAGRGASALMTRRMWGGAVTNGPLQRPPVGGCCAAPSHPWEAYPPCAPVCCGGAGACAARIARGWCKSVPVRLLLLWGERVSPHLEHTTQHSTAQHSSAQPQHTGVWRVAGRPLQVRADACKNRKKERPAPCSKGRAVCVVGCGRLCCVTNRRTAALRRCVW